MGKKKRKRINVRKLNPEGRKRNAQKWLTQPKPRFKDLLAAYAKRYAVSHYQGFDELIHRS
jgi:hypothetical protein